MLFYAHRFFPFDKKLSIKLQLVVSERNKPIQTHACQKLSNVFG